MSNPPSNTRRFINAAWSLLFFQLIAAVGAVAVTGYALQRAEEARERAEASPGMTTATATDGSGPAAPAPAPPTPAPATAEQPATPPTCMRISNRYLVPANAGWCDTGLSVGAGDTVTVPEVRGQWTTSGEPQWGRGGWYGAHIDDAVIPSEMLSSLIGRIGDTPVAIGNATSFVAPVAGRLYLGINDNAVLNDNQGWLEVTVMLPVLTP